MSKPDDVSQEAWDAAVTLVHESEADKVPYWEMGDGLSRARLSDTLAIARAIMSAKAEERQAIEALVSEYVWDDHALEQATNIGLACHHQSLEILEAIRSRT